MLSIILSVRNTSQMAVQCLASIARAVRVFAPSQLEVILIDDASEPSQGIPALFDDFRRQLAAEIRVTALRSLEHQHYTRALAYGFSAASGNALLFVSHDMMLTADYVRTLLAVAATDASIGVVRGVSPYVDCFPQYVVCPPLPIRTFKDLDGFARYVRDYWGLQWVEDPTLTGDSMLITREAIEKIGVFDPRYFGYFGDIDFGLRLQRAGFKLVCARCLALAAGEGKHQDLVARTGEGHDSIHTRRMDIVRAAYAMFREKWDLSLPPHPATADTLDYARLRSLPSLPGGEYQPPITPEPSSCETLLL